MSTSARIVGAALIGVGSSSLLLWLSYAVKSDLLFWPQAPGFVVCWITRGIHNANVIDYWAITMPVNAIVYAMTFLVARNLVNQLLPKRDRAL